MNSKTVTYAVMLAAFGGGIVAVLKAGSGLRAAPWLEGTWTLDPTHDVSDDEAAPKWLLIEQSGRSLRVQMEDGLRLVGRADVEISRGPEASRDRVRLALRSPPWTLVAEGEHGGHEFSFILTGPRRYEFNGIRDTEPSP